jgi:hypothetical protein
METSQAAGARSRRQGMSAPVPLPTSRIARRAQLCGEGSQQSTQHLLPVGRLLGIPSLGQILEKGVQRVHRAGYLPRP